MLTGNYLQRFLFKWKSVILIILMISVMAAVLSFQVNRWVPNYALSFAGLIARQFQTQISFKTVHYSFPDYIIFKNVEVLGSDGSIPMLQASRVTIGFFFNNIVISGMAVNLPVLKDYLTLHGKKIRAWARTLPKRNLHLLVPDGRFYPAGYAKGGPIAFNMDLGLDQDRLNAHGSWTDNGKFNYEISGGIHNSGFDLDKFALKKNHSSMDLWGGWHDNDIYWKGFIFYEKLYILDINGNLNIQDKNIILKRLSFAVNGNDVAARGNCSRQNLFQCDADIALKNMDFHLHAQNTPQGLAVKGRSDLNGTHLDFEGLKARIINGSSLKLRIKQMQGIFSIKGDKYTVPFENLLASIDFSDPYRQTIGLSVRTLGGRCDSRIFMDTASLPPGIKAQGTFNGISMAHGLLSGTFDLRSLTPLELSGTLALHNGDFNDTRLQAWAAKTLQMPSLDHLSGADFACRFKIDGKSKIVEDMELSTDDFDLSGFFNTDEDDLVSSQGSVRFSKNLLSESAVGRHIIGLVRGAWTLPFEFRLSGNVYRMNFQWDDSPLKDKVRRHLFSFFKKMIDRRMDAHPAYSMTIPNESVSPG